FSGSKAKIKAGETITLKDSAKVLEDFTTIDKGGFDVSISGNDLKITAKSSAKDGQIKFQKITQKHVGKSVLYKHKDFQNLAIFKSSDPIPMILNVEVEKLGELEIIKK